MFDIELPVMSTVNYPTMRVIQSFFLVTSADDYFLDVMVFFNTVRFDAATMLRNKNWMTADELNNFVAYCKRIQPQTQENIRKFFEGVVGFPYDKELLLQAYLFLNIQRLFPKLL